MFDTGTEVHALPALHERLATLAFESGERTTELVIGQRKIMALLPQIRQLRQRCGQQDDLTTDAQCFIAANAIKGRRTAAVFIRRGLDLEACVLFFEHTRFGIGLGLMRAGDAVGESLVVGPEPFRLQYVHLATQSLLRRWRIHGISLTVRFSLDDCVKVFGPQDEHRRLTQRNVFHRLKLADTYEAMLANMGPRTRRSLAGKRRHLEQKAHVSFLPALEPLEAREAMMALRQRSWPIRSSKFCHIRYNLLCRRPEFFSMGLRLPDGAWLSLVSGWRRNGVTFIDLQMNDKGFKKESLSAVMRAFLLEHEIALQQQLIHFVGGCSVLLGRYCEQGEVCTDIILSRPGLRSALLKSVIPFINPKSPYERLAAEQ